MRLVFLFVASLALAACETTDAQRKEAAGKWAAVSVRPDDPAPPSCDGEKSLPYVPKGEVSDVVSVKEYTRLQDAFAKVETERRQCGAWAKGQRQ